MLLKTGGTSGYVSAGFRVTRLANIGQQGVQLVQKLVGVGILFFGARLVIEGKLSVGQLIAFNMLSGQVAAPIVRLAQLWQDFQQVGISVERLGDILNTRTELPGSRMALPPIKGGVRFDQVTFRYRPDAAEVLSGIDLDIVPGEVVGIVGESGSGKSTLGRGLVGAYKTDGGKIEFGQGTATTWPWLIQPGCAGSWAWCCRRTSCSTAASARTLPWPIPGCRWIG